MTEEKKIITKYATIVLLLEQFPELRDDDRKLVQEFWARELYDERGYSPDTMVTLRDALQMLVIGASGRPLSSYESIVRLRRKAQEEHEELRGESYAEREAKTVEVKTDMRAIAATEKPLALPKVNTSEAETPHAHQMTIYDIIDEKKPNE